MRRILFLLTAVTGAATLVCIALYASAPSPPIYTLAITFGTTFYHFAMRLVVGYGFHARFRNHIDHTRAWFHPRRFEPKLYALIQVRRWKKYVPSFAPATFQLERASVKQVVQAMCQSEIIHEVIMLLSFVPVLFSLWLGSFGIFLLTSLAASLLDSVFVILQRYNRPRLVRLIK